MEQLVIQSMKEEMIEECVDLYIDTFTKEPWKDEYESRDQVVRFFKNHFNNNYFCGYVGMIDGRVVALSLGMQKPWIEGMEYYIDEFCVSYKMQGKGIGSRFIRGIEKEIGQLGMNGMILNTEEGYPAKEFYIKNGFHVLDGLIVLGK